MKTIILTGGIAAGKSTALALLQNICGESIAIFDSDACVSQLLNSGTLAEELCQNLGENAILPNRQANRPFLRDIIFHNPLAKKTLENILHPRIEQEYLALSHTVDKKGLAKALIADIPLYFETGCRYRHDLVVVISCSVTQQRCRLQRRNNFDDSLIDAILSAQLPLLNKENMSDVVLWNGGDLASLKQQIETFAHHYIL